MGKKSRQKWLNREQKVEKAIRKNKKIKKALKFSLIGLVILVILGVSGFYGWKKYHKVSPVQTNNQMNQDNQVAVIDTNKGIIKVQLLSSAAPKTVENFIKLSNEGFYNGTKFHRIIKDFMIQGGDPLSKDDTKKESWGTGDPGYKFDDEINPWELGVDTSVIEILQKQGYKYDHQLKSVKNLPGYMAMANSGPNTNGSQFFIITQNAQPQLDGKHTVFGKVIEGMETVYTIADVKTDSTNDRPLEDVVINKITIEKIDTSSESKTPTTGQQTENNSGQPIKIQATDEKGNPVDIEATPVK